MTWEVALASLVLPATAVAVRWRRRALQAAQVRAALVGGRSISGSHAIELSPGLANLGGLVEQARTLRLLAEAPLTHLEEPLAEGPWGRRMRCRDYDVALADLRREIWEWMLALTRLGESERRVLAELGLTGAPFRRLLYVSCDRGEDLWTEGLIARAPNPEEVSRELLRLRMELERFERAVCSITVGPYRAAG
jgi:hypothetical protein